MRRFEMVLAAALAVGACETTAPWELETLTGAFVQVDRLRPDGQWVRKFSGWLYKESPSLNVVEDAVYDVWPKSCEMTHPGAGESAPPTLSAGPVRMDVDRHVVTVAGSAVQLPLKEFELLHVLLANAGRVMTREQLIDRVWGSDYVGDTKTLDVHVKRLRAKLEPEPSEPKYLVTVRGLGYKLEV